MSYPSGSTLKVLLDNGASPNTGPFDLYVNSITASSNGILIANDVPKNDLSSSGYTFVTPIETFQVWARSDGSITNADVFILGNVPGYNKSIAVTASYDASLTPGLITASVFLDNGYGPQIAGTIPSALNSCPSTTGIGTSSLNSAYNTAVYLKDHETGSNYIKFFANGSATSEYYYHIPAFSGSGANITSTNVCVDLSGGGYQTVATNSINIYPTASIKPTIKVGNPAGDTSQIKRGLIIKANGSNIYSGSTTSLLDPAISVPGNAFIEITSSILQAPIWQAGYSTETTNSLNLKFTYHDGEYNAATIFDITQPQFLSGSSQTNIYQYSFYAVPGAYYTTLFDAQVVAGEVGINIYPEVNGSYIRNVYSITSGKTAHTIEFTSGEIIKYSDVSCVTQLGGECTWVTGSNGYLSIPIGSEAGDFSSSADIVSCAASGVNSLKYSSFDTNRGSLSTSPETLVVGSVEYVFAGMDECQLT